MPKVAKVLFLVVLAGLIFMLSTPAFAQDDPQGTPDSIYINVVPYADSVIFQVRLNTDNTGLNQIGGISLPFLVTVSNGALISLDTSVSRTFAGSVCQTWALRSTGTDSGGPDPTVSPVQFVIGAIDFSGGISAGNNLLLATIKLNVNGALLDTITIDSMSTVSTKLGFSTAGATDYTPRWYAIPPFVWTLAVKDRPIGEKSALPTSYDLGQNFPNPFNANTQIQFALPKSGHVKLEIFNVLGQKVKTLVDEELTAGYKQVTWDGTDQRGDQVSSGIYFYRVRMGNQYTEMKKMVMIK